MRTAPMRVLGAILAIASLGFGTASALPLTFGARTLEIPTPEGMIPAKDASPMLFQASAAYLPPGNRLVELYATPDDLAALSMGRDAPMERQFQVQTLKSLDGVPLSNRDFRTLGDTIERELVKLMPEVDARAGEMMSQGNATLQQQTGVDVAASMQKLEYLGVFRREPWASFFTLVSSGSISVDGESENFRTYNSGAIALIDHQLVYLYTYVDASTPNARRVAEDAVARWAEAVHAANPDTPGIEEQARERDGFSFGPMIGGAIGAGLIALLFGFLRRLRNS